MESYLSTIILFAGLRLPKDWLYCEGQELSINEYSNLFSIVGTMYGGDGKSTFGLPDLRHKETDLRGARYIIAVYGIYPPNW